jgi:four helix bundle protein
VASRNYRDLIVWQKAMDLATATYRATKDLPKDETYGLRAQIRRAAVSIPSNIAEGEGRGTFAELCRFLRIAYGSLRELETQFLLSERLGYLTPSAVGPLMQACAEVGRLINGLLRARGGDGK